MIQTDQSSLLMTHADSISAIIVTFEPNLTTLEDNIIAVIDQVDIVIVIDNGSSNQKKLVQLLQQLAADKIKFHGLKDNQGVGAAHNHGISIAKEFSSDYVLLLDQDTQVKPKMIDALHDATLQLKSSGELGQLAALGARYTSENGNDSFFVRFGLLKFQRHSCDDCEHVILPTDFLISSGSLIPMKALEIIGDMDASLFIDHIDTEWFLRAKSKGFQAYGVCQALMQHGLGEQMHKVRFLGIGRVRNVPQHKPFRYYYMFRNSIALYRRKDLSKLWKWNDLQRLIQIFIFYGVCYGPRIKNLSMMMRGIRDGLANNMGKLPE